MAARDLIDITATASRETIRIDGIAYPLRRATDLTLQAFADVEQIGPHLDSLLCGDAVAGAADRELSDLLSRACRHAVVASPAVLACLSDFQRLQVTESFFAALAAEPLAEKPSRPRGGEPCAWDEVVARLQRFYGGEIASWWTEVPLGLIRRYLAMLPRLEAEESLRAADCVAVGAGVLMPEDRRRLMAAWRAAAGWRASRSTPASPGVLQQAGIGTRTVTKRSAEGGA